MKKLLALLLLWPLLAQSATYTLTWCPVKNPFNTNWMWYEICVESVVGACDLSDNFTYQTSYSIKLGNTVSAFMRVRALVYSGHDTVYSDFSNPVEIISGPHPP